jgi:hypothetical protein
MTIPIWFSRVLTVLGALTLLGAIILAGYIVYQIGPGSAVRVDRAAPRDVRFVMNWCELGESRIKKVVHSYESPRNITGDHLDAYAIEITSVEIRELTSNSWPYQTWFRADEAPPVLHDAITEPIIK